MRLCRPFKLHWLLFVGVGRIARFARREGRDRPHAHEDHQGRVKEAVLKTQSDCFPPFSGCWDQAAADTPAAW
jgi:hypothetical protein